jgi:hypothetical protein
MEQHQLMEQISEATELARSAFAIGDTVTGIAATVLAAQLLQLARITSAHRRRLPKIPRTRGWRRCSTAR